MRIKLFENFKDDNVLYRNTSVRWLTEFLEKKTIFPYRDRDKRFVSFSKKEDSGGADNFGDICIEFNSKKIYAQGALEIEYDIDFFEEHSDICMYVTGYKNETDYYKNYDYDDAEDFQERGQGDQDVVPWDSMIEDYENEAEVVIKKLKYEDKLITNVILPEEDEKLLKLLNKLNINYKIE